MPSSTITSDSAMSAPPVPAQAKCSFSTLKNTGCRKVCSQPPSGGRPTTRPSTAAGIARMTSGTVITRGDSWMWSCTSAEARFSPQKVRNMRRNMNRAVKKAVIMPTAQTT